MITQTKTLAATLAAAVVLAGSTAHAVSVNFNYQVPTDGSGKTSAVGVDANNVALPGFFIETFDQPGSSATSYTAPGVNSPNITVAAGGGFNTLNPLTDLNISQGTMSIRQGSVTNVAATPAGNTTFYAYAPGPNNPDGANARIRVKYDAFLSSIPGYYLSYLGLYYGSIDTYNDIAFYSGSNLISGTGIMSDGVITGSELLGIFSGISGNQTQDASNIYVNLFFNPTEQFDAFEFRTTGIAFEADNIVTGFAPVPEPSTMMLLGAGLFGLAVYARRKRG